jgi:uncharacterized membrane protein
MRCTRGLYTIFSSILLLEGNMTHITLDTSTEDVYALATAFKLYLSNVHESFLEQTVFIHICETICKLAIISILSLKKNGN